MIVPVFFFFLFFFVPFKMKFKGLVYALREKDWSADVRSVYDGNNGRQDWDHK